MDERTATVVRKRDQRTVETPNAVMTTLAAPSLGGARQSLWQVRMRAGQAGPWHAMDAEQVWTVLSGSASVQVGGAAHALGPGDTIVLPEGVDRRIVGDPEQGLVALVTGAGRSRALLPDGTDRGIPDWIA